MHETESFEKVKQNRSENYEAMNSNPSLSMSVTSSSNESGRSINYGSTYELLSSNGEEERKSTANSMVSVFISTSNVRLNEIKKAYSLYKWHMVGTALSWLLFDIDFYANGLFNHDVTSVLLSQGISSRYMCLCRLTVL
jgi:hypothetical protein